jgi:hypothetical protein
VWCAIFSGGIIGPYFFEDEEGRTVTVNAERYTAMLETFLRNELNLRQLNSLWFQQDGATTTDSARISITVLRELFPGRLISRFGDINWPACSPDLLAPVYFLWGYVKSKAYETRPENIDDLKQRIRECFKEYLMQCYNVLWHPCRLDCRSVLNNKEVTHKVSYSNSNA